MGFVEWRPVPGMPYSVSSEGGVRRDEGGRGAVEGRFLSGWVSGNGYRYIELYQDGERETWLLHQLVATVWHGPRPSDEHEVDHLDGDIRNNHPANLQWVTRQENVDRYWMRRRAGQDGRDPWEVALERLRNEEPAEEEPEPAFPY